jgi:hypothetical protein
VIFVLAQWADLATYLLAVALRPWGESGLLGGLSPAGVVGWKAAGVAVVLVASRRLSARQRWWVLAIGAAVGLLGSLTNVVGGLI